MMRLLTVATAVALFLTAAPLSAGEALLPASVTAQVLSTASATPDSAQTATAASATQVQENVVQIQDAPAQTMQPAAVADVPHAEEEHAANADIIMPHIMDSNYLEIPWWGWAKKVYLPTFEPVHIGGLTIDMSPTKHVVMLLIAAFLCGFILIYAARSQARSARAGRPPRGLANAMEAVVLWVRSDVILANIGHHGEKFVPYLLTVFFFILFANLLGLVPYGATATSNISVTATLAVVAFFVTEIAGMRALGAAGYMRTIIFWPSEGAWPMKLGLSLIISPVELMGKFTKPFALAIRLFANMTAGHVIVLAFIGMVFTFGNPYVAPLPIIGAVAIMLLEVLVAFLQAFIFTMLVSVFIGQVRSAHH